MELRSRWFSQWRHEYGLSLRRPSRRYNVPKAVLAERLEIGWLNVYRVRAAVAALKGYDPHVENWDQSPFHHNETCSENKPTLAVAGVEVPLAEHMFKADGEIVLQRLQNHIRRRGYGKWVSAATWRRTCRSCGKRKLCVRGAS